MDRVNSVMVRKLGLSHPADNIQPDTAPVTPMRQMRRALSRAADRAAGLSVVVLGIAEETCEAETLIEDGPEGWIVLGLRDSTNPGLAGLFLINPELRTALVEMQTMGALSGTAAQSGDDTRPVTGTDGALSMPFAEQVMVQLAEAGFGAPDLEFSGFDLGVMADLRTAGLVLTPGAYRSWRVTLEMAGTQQQGEILFAVRQKEAVVPVSAQRNTAWSSALKSALADAPAELDAVLCKMRMSIANIERFEVGQLLHLAGTTVGSVTLTGPCGAVVAPARLGQVAGQRAVRIQPLEVALQEVKPAAMAPAAQNPPQDHPKVRV